VQHAKIQHVAAGVCVCAGDLFIPRAYVAYSLVVVVPFFFSISFKF
jgi:hypothetical protein